MLITLPLVLTLLAAAPAPALDPADRDPTVSVKNQSPASAIKLKVEPFVTGVTVPWDFAWLPDGRMIFNERDGHVRIVGKDGKLAEKPILTLSVFRQPAENGLMGLCLHPEFATNGWVYVSYGTREDIRVVRYTFKDDALGEPKEILTGLPSGSNHAGCRVRFGPDKKLYITAGEKFKNELAQDLSSLGGKIHRVDDDGTIPADNPYNNADGKAKKARAEIWSSGNRNPQGIDWQPGTNDLFETEHGPSGEAGAGGGGDELNVIDKGANYGWPTIHHAKTADGMISPLLEWTSGIAPASGHFYTGDKIPALKGAFLVGGLKGTSHTAVWFKGRKIEKHEVVLKGYGRLRAIGTGPDGALYVGTSNKDGRGRAADDDDKILRIVAEDAAAPKADEKK